MKKELNKKELNQVSAGVDPGVAPTQEEAEAYLKTCGVSCRVCGQPAAEWKYAGGPGYCLGVWEFQFTCNCQGWVYQLKHAVNYKVDDGTWSLCN